MVSRLKGGKIQRRRREESDICVRSNCEEGKVEHFSEPMKSKNQTDRGSHVTYSAGIRWMGVGGGSSVQWQVQS